MVSFFSYECFEELGTPPIPLVMGEGDFVLYFSNKITQEVMCKSSLVHRVEGKGEGLKGTAVYQGVSLHQWLIPN